jgi:simple sugar transport system permease protein
VNELLQILALALAAMVPITLASLGEVLAERAGIVNIGLEGIMLTSAFLALWTAEACTTVPLLAAWAPWCGLLGGVIAGAVLGLMHGIIAIRLQGDQIISGIGLNLFGLGFVAFGIVAVWKTAGFHQVPPAGKVPPFTTPWGTLSPLVPVTIVLTGVLWYVLHRTVLGLRWQAVGENPYAADVAGIAVDRLRYLATVTGAALAGLAGAYLSIDWLSTITKELPAGRGFIALANVVFSGLNPWLALLGGFLFGFFDTLALWVDAHPMLKPRLPFAVHNFIKMLPYVATLLVVTIAMGQARFPRSIGQPYRRQ